jgi:hypothetical protein
MKILIGQNHLHTIGGSETYTYTLVEELVRRGHHVDLVCNVPGMVSEIMKQNFKIRVNSLEREYDYCFLNHNTVVRGVIQNNIKSKKMFQVCHGTTPQLEQPYVGTGVEFISISEEVREHLKSKGRESVVIENGVNLQRFSEKETNDKITSVFSLAQSNSLNKLLKNVCDKKGIKFSYHNKHTNPIFNIENEIFKHDLIITLGRGAYEALACGKNVVIADQRSYQGALMDGFITSENIKKLMLKNCSGRTNRKEVTEQSIWKELEKYDPMQGKANRKFAEENLDIRKKVDKMLSL